MRVRQTHVVIGGEYALSTDSVTRPLYAARVRVRAHLGNGVVQVEVLEPGPKSSHPENVSVGQVVEVGLRRLMHPWNEHPQHVDSEQLARLLATQHAARRTSESALAFAQAGSTT